MAYTFSCMFKNQNNRCDHVEPTIAQCISKFLRASKGVIINQVIVEYMYQCKTTCCVTTLYYAI